MARYYGKSDPSRSAPASLDRKVPTIEELMRPPQLPPWVVPFPSPSSNPDPFGPVPILPLSPIEVDPPWLGRELASRTAGGLLGMMQRSGVIDPSDQQAPPAGGLVELLHEYLRNRRERSDQAPRTT